MNVKLWGKCLGTGEKMKQKRKKLTLFEQVSQLRVDTEFHRKNQVGSWPQARTVASAPCESVHTPCAHINSHPAGPLGPEVQLLLDCCCGQSLLGLLHAYKTEGWIWENSNMLVACWVEHSDDLIRTLRFLLLTFGNGGRARKADLARISVSHQRGASRLWVAQPLGLPRGPQEDREGKRQARLSSD